MKNDNCHSITLIKDDEIQRLKYPLSKGDHFQLQNSLLENGCINPIIIWQGTIVDGHKRYDICKQWSIDFRVKQCDCRCKPEVIMFVCRNELNRSDIPSEMKKYLFGRLLRAELDTKAYYYLRNRSAHSSKATFVPDRIYQKHKTAASIGKSFNLSGGTILKYGVYSDCLDQIFLKDADIAAQILNGQLKISHENVVELSKLSKTQLEMLKSTYSKRHGMHIMYSDIYHELKHDKASIDGAYSSTTEKKTMPGIRKMPKYDPEAEVHSLIFTIPSWIHSIERVYNQTDFSKITVKTKDDLLSQLTILQTSIISIEQTLKESAHE